MANEMFTQLPSTGSAQLTDIICAVQGFSSPSSLGTSVQETLQQVYDLFQSNLVLYNAGNPNGSVAGTTFQLCWDTSNMILYVCSTSGSASTAVWSKAVALTGGTGITISQSGNNIQISTTGASTSWVTVTGTSAMMVTDQGYIANNSGLVTLTLPSTSSVGDPLYIIGQGAGGWSIAQSAGQQIIIGNKQSTIGVTGSVASTNQYDSLSLICTVENTTWTTLGGPQGELDIN